MACSRRRISPARKNLPWPRREAPACRLVEAAAGRSEGRRDRLDCRQAGGERNRVGQGKPLFRKIQSRRVFRLRRLLFWATTAGVTVGLRRCRFAGVALAAAFVKLAIFFSWQGSRNFAFTGSLPVNPRAEAKSLHCTKAVSRAGRFHRQTPRGYNPATQIQVFC